MYNHTHYPKKEEEGFFIKIIKLIQWANYHGGIVLILIVAGVFSLLSYPILIFFGKKDYIVILIGFALIAIAFLVRYFDNK